MDTDRAQGNIRITPAHSGKRGLIAFALWAAIWPLQQTDAEDAPTYQLEAGKNVRVIDIGSDGTDALANAVKALNEPKNKEAAAMTTDGGTASDTPQAPSNETPALPNADNVSPAGDTGKFHPAWLIGTWVINGACDATASTLANTFVIAHNTGTFGKEMCRATALSTSQKQQVVILYACGDKTTSRQRVHRFERADDGSLLLDGFDRAVKCGGG